MSERPAAAEEYDPPLDPGIRPAVLALASAGVETFESCEGGPGHAYPEPTVRFYGDRSEGLAALAIALRAGLDVVSLRRVWPVIEGEPTGPWWELALSPTRAVRYRHPGGVNTFKVISWLADGSFRDYVDERGRNVIRRWLRGLPDEARAAIEIRLQLIRTQERLSRPHVATEGQGILKIRATAGNVQYRPLACYGPGRQTITLLVGAEEHDRRLTKGAFTEALKRKRIVHSDPHRSCDHRLD